MPWGIPPSNPRAQAAGEYCDTVNEQLHQLIVQVVTPVAEFAETVEDATTDVHKSAIKHLSKVARKYERGVNGVQDHVGALLGYVAQGSEQGVLQIQDWVNQQQGTTAFVSTDGTKVESTAGPIHAAAVADVVQVNVAPEYHGPNLGTKGQTKYEALVIPEQPKPLTTFPCPEAPQVLTGLGAPVGSAVWCQAVEQTLTWLDKLGELLAEWLDKSIQPERWALWVETWRPPDDWASWVKSLVTALRDILGMVIRLFGRGARTLIDIIRCAWYYTRTLTPMKRPNAYLAIVTLQNVLQWINDSRVGSQSYLGLTLGTRFTLPALQDTLVTLASYLMPLENPSIEWVIPAWLRGFVTDKAQMECLMRVNGLNPTNWWPYLQARGETLTPEGAIQYARRHGKSRQEQLDWLRSLGFVDPNLAEARLELYDELPTVGDHLHWLQRNVFDDAYVERYGLLNGFDTRFWTKFGTQLEAQGYTQDRARLEYAAHWQRPSPTQMLEWVYRLRPDKVGAQVAFTLDDMQAILAEQDFTEYDRARFAATAYRVPALTYLRDMHRMGILTDSQMASYHADLGYSTADSERFVQVDSYRRQRQRATQGSGWSPAALRKASAVGQVTDGFVRERMRAMGYQDTDAADLLERGKADLQYRVLSRSISTELSASVKQVREALRVGVMTEGQAATSLTALGFGQIRAEGIAALESASAKTQRVKGVLQRIRHAYNSGEVDRVYAEQALTGLGIVPDAIASYLAMWTIENTPGRKRVTAQEIVKAVRDGLMDSTEAGVRLHNLGYTEADTLLFLADAAQQTVTTQEALQYLKQLDGKTQGSQLVQLGQHTIGLSERIVAKLKQQQPPSKLQKWLKAGIMEASEVRTRLRLYGWADDAIDKWIEEVAQHGEEEEEAP